MNELTAEKAAELREPFPAEMVGKLPRITCRACSDADGRVCEKHNKKECDGCGNWITGAHIHLDYVGHAAATDRLLKVDPEWTWEPMATNPDTGAPMQTDGGLWIRLTVCGVTRPGWGDGKNVKEMIGDALRNAAMRFGVALDLWAKENLNAAPEVPPMNAEQHTAISKLLADLSVLDAQTVKAWWKDAGYPKAERLNAEQAEAVIRHLSAVAVGADG